MELPWEEGTKKLSTIYERNRWRYTNPETVFQNQSIPHASNSLMLRWCHLLWESFYDLPPPRSMSCSLQAPTAFTHASVLALSTLYQKLWVAGCVYIHIPFSRLWAPGQSRAALHWLKLPPRVCGYARGKGPRHMEWAVSYNEVPCRALLGDSGLHGLVTPEGFDNLYGVTVQ